MDKTRTITCMCVLGFSLASFVAASTPTGYCSYFGNRAPAPQPNLVNCTWYRENSCCLQQEIDALFPLVEPPLGASKKCRNYVNYLMCYVCAPTQSTFYQRERLTVCEDFCKDFFSACGDAVLKGRRISDMYTSATDFCLDRKYNLLAGKEGCFTLSDSQRTLTDSAPGRIGINWLLLHLCAVIGLVWNVGPGSRFVAALTLIALLLSSGGSAFLPRQTVVDMAANLGEELIKFGNISLQRDKLQSLYDDADISMQSLNPPTILASIKDKLIGITNDLEIAAVEIQRTASSAFTSIPMQGGRLDNLPQDVYQDADFAPWQQKLTYIYNGTFKRNVSFVQSIVKMPDNINRTDELTVNTIRWTSGIDEAFKNLTDRRNVRWLYFASETGIFRIYPAYEWATNFAGFRVDYDPRIRPWYLSATSGPKNIAIFLDCSNSMKEDDRMTIAKAAVAQVLNSLTRDDYVNIICARGYFYNSGGNRRNPTSYVLGCDNKALMRATPSNRKQLLEALGDVGAYGSGVEHTKALQNITSMLPTSSDHCLNILLFVSDGKDNDPSTYRSKCYERNRGQHGCGSLKVDFDGLLSTAEDVHSSKDARIVTVMVDNEGEYLTGKMACDNSGIFLRLPENKDIRTRMSPYYSYLAQLASDNSEKTKPTLPYIDLQGLGRVITLARAVFNPLNNTQLLGVLGVDAVLDDMEAALLDEQFGLSYAFLIDLEGKALIHPRLKPSADLIDDPVYPDIRDLELYEDKPYEFYDKKNPTDGVLADMKASRNGSSQLITGTRAEQTGSLSGGVKWVDAVKFTYYYDSVPGSDYSFAFVLTESDRLQYELNDIAFKANRPKNYYHEISKYGAELNPVTGHSDYKQITITRTQSVVKFSPRCFCDPTHYLLLGDPGFQYVDTFLNTNQLNNTGCTDGGQILETIRPTVWLTQQIQNDWLNRGKTFQDWLAWTSFGAANGVWRVYPGARWARPFDPTRQSWYHRAIANPPQDLSLSSVYLDGGGVGKVVTLAQTVFERKPSNSLCTEFPKAGGCTCTSHGDCKSNYCYGGSCANHEVAGVVGADFRFSQFVAFVSEKLQINQTSPDLANRCGVSYNCPGTNRFNCSTKCLLINDAAEIVYDQSFKDAPVGDTRKYQHVPLGDTHGDIMFDLLERNVFNRISFSNRQGICQRSPYAPRLSETGIILTAEQEDGFYENRGPIPQFQNNYGCDKDEIQYQINTTIDLTHTPISALFKGPCSQGSYSIIKVEGTNLFLLTIQEDVEPSGTFFNFNCHIHNTAFRSGGFRLLEVACTRDIASDGTVKTCQRIPNPVPFCVYNSSCAGLLVKALLVLVAAVVSFLAHL